MNNKTINCYAFNFGERIRLEKIINKLEFVLIEDEPGYLIFKGRHSEYLYVKDFGSIVFIGFDRTDALQICKSLVSFKFPASDYPTEEYRIIVDSERKQTVSFNEINVSNLTKGIAHIIMLNLSQAVALDNYLFQSSNLLIQTREISKNLEITGNIDMPRRKLSQFIGKTMVLKNRIEENLFIFETSDLAWSDKNLSELDQQLRQELDFVNRHQSLQNSLTVVKENLDLFRDILQHKHSSTLEWIIIILILIEIIQILADKL